MLTKNNDRINTSAPRSHLASPMFVGPLTGAGGVGGNDGWSESRGGVLEVRGRITLNQPQQSGGIT